MAPKTSSARPPGLRGPERLIGPDGTALLVPGPRLQPFDSDDWS
jgi:hypothetical protein